jgi:hypothetical protein
MQSLLHYIEKAQENKKNKILLYNIAEDSKRTKRNEENVCVRACVCVCVGGGGACVRVRVCMCVCVCVFLDAGWWLVDTLND